MNEASTDVTKFEKRAPGAVEPQTTDIVLAAIQRNMDPALIEKMMDLSERNERNQARKDYMEAMAAFKADPPEIEKDKTVSFGSGKTSYSHASLANVTGKINRALSVHGLSASWKTTQDEKSITVTCTISHWRGHSESTSLTAAPDNSGSKNSIQAIGSTISYLERYTLLALTGLATHEMDDDGQGTTEFITKEQQAEINKLLRETKSDVSKFLQVYHVETVDTIPANLFDAVKATLKLKGKQNANN